MTERTGKLREKYNRDKDRFEFVGACPFCQAETVMEGSGAVEQSCEHFTDRRWGCGGVIMIFRKEETAAARSGSHPSQQPAYA